MTPSWTERPTRGTGGACARAAGQADPRCRGGGKCGGGGAGGQRLPPRPSPRPRRLWGGVFPGLRARPPPLPAPATPRSKVPGGDPAPHAGVRVVTQHKHSRGWRRRGVWSVGGSPWGGPLPSPPLPEDSGQGASGSAGPREAEGLWAEVRGRPTPRGSPRPGDTPGKSGSWARPASGRAASGQKHRKPPSPRRTRLRGLAAGSASPSPLPLPFSRQNNSAPARPGPARPAPPRPGPSGPTVARTYSQLPSKTKRRPSKVTTWPSPYRVQVDAQWVPWRHAHFPPVQVLGGRGVGSRIPATPSLATPAPWEADSPGLAVGVELGARGVGGPPKLAGAPLRPHTPPLRVLVQPVGAHAARLALGGHLWAGGAPAVALSGAPALRRDLRAVPGRCGPPSPPPLDASGQRPVPKGGGSAGGQGGVGPLRRAGRWPASGRWARRRRQTCSPRTGCRSGRS